MSPDLSDELSPEPEKPTRAPRPARSESMLDGVQPGGSLTVYRTAAGWAVNTIDQSGNITTVYDGPNRPTL